SDSTTAISQLKFPFSLKEDQIDAVNAWIDNDFRGTIVYSTGTGKTEIAFECAKRVAGRYSSSSSTTTTTSLNVLLMVPRIILIEQNIRRLVSYGIPKDKIGAYFGERKQIREITICTYQSIIRNLDIIRRSNMVIFDEIHLIRDTAKIFSKIFDVVIEDHKKAILGLTATLDEKDLSKYNTILTLLPPVKRYPLKNAVNDKRLAKPIVIPLKVNLTEKEQNDYDTYSAKIKKISNRFKKYDAESMTGLLRKGGFVSGMAKAWFLNIRKRKLLLSCAENKLLSALNLITKKFPNEKIMIFSETIDSISKLRDMLELEGTKAMIIDSNTNSRKRQLILDQWGREFYPLLSVHTLEIGFDIPQVRIEIILATTSNMNQVIQRIGRVIRKQEGKDLALIYVIYVSDTKDDKIHDLFKKAITTTSTKSLQEYEGGGGGKEEDKGEEKNKNKKIEIQKNLLNNNGNLKKLKEVESKRLEKAYNIIESTLYEPMIVELQEEKQNSDQGKEKQKIETRKLYRVKSSIKEKIKYYDVDIENMTCTCPDFKFKLHKCKHIVATELFLF
ncbi:MAG TPA: DEAD/DEAH box helicase family protein, partial [Nitrososphaeraceae archaeon]|nr:DEAD/DEAH box helicase family protein [Nitrososphaeraceae archaeon]